MMGSLCQSREENIHSDHDSDYLSDHVISLLKRLKNEPMSPPGLMKELKHRSSFRQRYILLALGSGLVEMIPKSPSSRQQKYP